MEKKVKDIDGYQGCLESSRGHKIRSYYVDFTDMNYAIAIDNALTFEHDKFLKKKSGEMLTLCTLVDLT